MTNRTISNQNKAIALALMLALAILSPGSALAKVEGADRPVRGTASGTISINPATGALTGDTTGVISHLGQSAIHLEGTVAPTGEEGTFAGSATVTIVAANGDKLTGTAAVTSTATSTGRTTTVVVEITGGTGRFANARGTLTVICLSGPPSPVGEVLVSEIECTATGRIRY
jgi:membrane-associated protease RseP (regulator of RpoE activity)